MKGWMKLLLITGSIILVSVNLYLYRNKIHLNSGQQATLIQAHTVSYGEISDMVIVPGVVVPQEEQKIYLDSSLGSIEDVYVREGQVVEKGAELFKYDLDKINEDIKRTEVAQMRLLLQHESATEKKKGLIDDFKEQLVQNNEDIEKIESLKKKFIQMKSEAERQTKSVQMELNENQLLLDSLINQRAEMVVKSKISGRINSVNLVGGLDVPVIHISSENFKVIGTLSEYDLLSVIQGMGVTIKSRVIPNSNWKGHLTKINVTPVTSTTSNDKWSSYPVEFEFTDHTDDLKNGYHVTGEVKVNTKQNTIVIPPNALIQNGEKTEVLLVNTDTLDKREVTTGQINEEWVEITKGIDVGDRIVINPAQQLTTGTHVVIDNSINR